MGLMDAAGLWMWLGMMIVVAAWAGGAWLAIRFLARRDEGPPGRSAHDLLDARLARGEIGRREYVDLSALLEEEHGPRRPPRRRPTGSRS